jgi:hypothetical protein
MESHELLREVFQKCSPKQIADLMNLSPSMIYKWAEPTAENGSGTTNPLDRLRTLIECTNDPRLVQWICERAGGFFIRNPKAANTYSASVIPATNEIIQEFADMLSVIATAAHDNDISAKEAKNIRGRWEELKSVTEGFVRCCEQGNFNPIRNPKDV